VGRLSSVLELSEEDMLLLNVNEIFHCKCDFEEKQK